MCRELRMVSYSQHGSKQFCYNTSVSLKRDLLFDIGGRHPAPAIGPKPIWVDGKTPVGRDAPIAPPRGVAETHPTPAACTQQRIGASEKTTTFTDEAKYGVAPHGNHAAQPLFLCFVQARSGASWKQGFEGAPLFFSASKRRHPVK